MAWPARSKRLVAIFGTLIAGCPDGQSPSTRPAVVQAAEKPDQSPEIGGAMDVNTLADLLDRPETHQKVLGSYHGPYSLGVTQTPGPQGSSGFLLRVGDKDTKTFPASVSIDGYEIPVIVKGDFIAPRPQ